VTTAPTPAEYLELVAIDVAEQAAELVRSAAGTVATTTTKSSPTDVVTQTDLRSERLIRDELLARCPGSTIAGEEFDEVVGANSIGWIVDPIDGTVNFLYDLSVVAISIAATIDERVVAGAVVDVHRRETFSAAEGTGARRNGITIVAGDRADLPQALIATGFSYDAGRRAEEAAILTRLLPACRDIRCMGSAALNLCWVGCGRLDGFYERDLKVYDYAAGALIASEAGAMTEHPSNNGTDLMIAAGPDIFDSLRRLVEAVPPGGTNR
jgi:fructose-1,6-bisphosphatase/inositol monophosphatase family enzyme